MSAYTAHILGPRGSSQRIDILADDLAHARELARDHGVVFAVRALSIDYRKPARLDDWLEVTVAFEAVRAASILFRQSIRRGGEEVCEGRVRVASLSVVHFRPVAIPDFMLERLATMGLNPPAA